MHRKNISLLSSTTALVGAVLLFSTSPAHSRTNNDTLSSMVTLEDSEIYINNGNITTVNEAIDFSGVNAGGGTFATNGLNPANDTLSVGAGLKLLNNNVWDVSVDYGFDYMKDYSSHTGILKAGYKF